MSTPRPAVLIVDDAREIRDLIRLALADRYKVHEAADAVAGIDQLHAFRPAVCLVDIDLGGAMSGLDLLRVIRADARLADLRVLILTGSTDDADCARAMTLGAEAYFTKPFSPSKLGAWLDDLVAGHAMQPPDPNALPAKETAR